ADNRLGNPSGDDTAHYVPLYEAKMMHQFDHRWAGYSDNGKESVDIKDKQKSDANFEPSSRYWLPATNLKKRPEAAQWSKGWLMGWRDITNATNERTLIVGILPAHAVNHKIRLALFPSKESRSPVFAANANSLVLDYVARQK